MVVHTTTCTCHSADRCTIFCYTKIVGHADVTALVSTTTGNVAGTYYYDSFGNITSSSGTVDNNITYAGYQYDEETGLYYCNSRMYDPGIARFLQEDTYSGNPNDPLSLNLYTYCANNPLIYIDPTGHSWLSAAIGDAKTSPTIPYDAQAQGFIKAAQTTTSKTIIYYTPTGNSVISPDLIDAAWNNGIKIIQIGVQ